MLFDISQCIFIIITHLLCESGCRWENNIKMAVKEVGCEWINLAYDRGQWRAVVGRMLNVFILLNSRQWLYWLRDCAERN